MSQIQMLCNPIRLFGFEASWAVLKGIVAAGLSLGAVGIGFITSVY